MTRKICTVVTSIHTHFPLFDIHTYSYLCSCKRLFCSFSIFFFFYFSLFIWHSFFLSTTNVQTVLILVGTNLFCHCPSFINYIIYCILKRIDFVFTHTKFSRRRMCADIDGGNVTVEMLRYRFYEGLGTGLQERYGAILLLPRQPCRGVLQPGQG